MEAPMIQTPEFRRPQTTDPREAKLRDIIERGKVSLHKALEEILLGSEYVFYHPAAKKKNAKGTFNGKRYYEVKTAFQNALKEAGIEAFRFHDLRHCFASVPPLGFPPWGRTRTSR